MGLCCRMSINFLVSRSHDIAFHLSHRVREGIVVRNSMIGGRWGKEEIAMCVNPFIEGQYFDVSITVHDRDVVHIMFCLDFTCVILYFHASQMSIRCAHHKFKVFVNGQHVFDYSHRFRSFREIDMLEIEGDVQLSYVHF